jgi:CRISPR/Cas system CSM-associated protein Csm2 small subunit
MFALNILAVRLLLQVGRRIRVVDKLLEVVDKLLDVMDILGPDMGRNNPEDTAAGKATTKDQPQGLP